MKTFAAIDRTILSTFSPGFGGAVVPEWIKPWLENGLGSVTLFASNTPNFEVTANLIKELRSYNPHVIITIDEEGIGVAATVEDYETMRNAMVSAMIKLLESGQDELE